VEIYRLWRQVQIGGGQRLSRCDNGLRVTQGSGGGARTADKPTINKLSKTSP
jgi:hypothetical protein